MTKMVSTSDSIDIQSITRFPLMVLFLAIVAICSSAVIAFFSYRASFTYAQKNYHDMYLSKARLIAKEAYNSSKKPEKELISLIKSYYFSLGTPPRDEYLCMVDRDALLLIHTAHEDKVGKNAGNNLILNAENLPICTLGELTKRSEDFVGNYISSAGERQIAAFVTIKGLNWTVGIHRNKAALLKEVRKNFLPVIIGFGIVILIFLPVSFAILIFSYYRTIRKRELIEKHLQNSLREKEIMLMEIHHRVKNNLQVVISLINLQAMEDNSGHYHDHLLTIEQRIRSMASVHEKLYQSGNYASIDFTELINALVLETRHAFSKKHSSINIETSIDEITIGLDQAIPCAIIINELLINSFKHAFLQQESGKISISAGISADTGELKLHYEDNGPGYPLKDEAKSGTGLTIIRALATQLRGDITMENREGAFFTLSFKPEVNNK